MKRCDSSIANSVYVFVYENALLFSDKIPCNKVLELSIFQKMAIIFLCLWW